MNVTKKSSRLAADFCEQEINLCYLFHNTTCPIVTIKTDGVNTLFPPTFYPRNDSHMNNPGWRASWVLILHYYGNRGEQIVRGAIGLTCSPHIPALHLLPIPSSHFSVCVHPTHLHSFLHTPQDSDFSLL